MGEGEIKRAVPEHRKGGETLREPPTEELQTAFVLQFCKFLHYPACNCSSESFVVDGLSIRGPQRGAVLVVAVFVVGWWLRGLLHRQTPTHMYTRRCLAWKPIEAGPNINYPFFSRGLWQWLDFFFFWRHAGLMRKTGLSVELSRHTWSALWLCKCVCVFVCAQVCGCDCCSSPNRSLM